MSEARPEVLRHPERVREYVQGELALGVENARHPWHWPSLTTQLDVRIVVSREYDLARHTWRFFSDRRAEKVAQLAFQPAAIALFYHGEHRCQLRLRGQCHEVLDEGFRQNLWRQQSDAAKANYATLHAPGTVLDSAGSDLPSDWTHHQAALAEAYVNFGVYELAIERYEFLQLRQVGALRSRWAAADGTFEWLVP